MKHQLYSYSVNDPVYFADPTGHCPMCVVAIAGGIIGGAYAGYEGYQHGARGLRLIGDISGGAGTGILVGLTGGAVGEVATDIGFGGVASGAFGGAAGGELGGGINGTVCWATGNGGKGQIASDAAEGALTGALAGAAGGALQPAVQGGSNFDPFSSPRVFGPKAQQLYYNSAASTGLDMVANADASKLGGRKDPGGCQ